jgi:hypothetical protein
MADKAGATYHPLPGARELADTNYAWTRLCVLLAQRSDATEAYVTEELGHRVKVFERVRRETTVGGRSTPMVDAIESVINDITSGRL